MKQNTFVVIAILCFTFLTYVFSGGLSLPFWQGVVGYLVCAIFWLMLLAPALKINEK